MRIKCSFLFFLFRSPGTHLLQVPKKTRLYLEQTKRETEQAPDMHRIFQRDLAKLKLTAARTYVQLLTDGKVWCAFGCLWSWFSFPTLNFVVQLIVGLK